MNSETLSKMKNNAIQIKKSNNKQKINKKRKKKKEKKLKSFLKVYLSSFFDVLIFDSIKVYFFT